ncbi:50S ribosomal protein L4 [archaeon]|nr:50S ribosomal protein L4 [archaeon]|tara:strand:- start:3159 stop:3980 length:822 start_codon:yes stop_codon:yes gene_type:complete
MKINILDLTGKEIKKIDTPEQFNEEYHPNLIKRAVQVIQANKRSAYGAKPRAGKRSSSKLSRRRKDYKGAYNHGMSRVPRKVSWRRGMQFGYVGAWAPGTVGGRKAHPPKAEKIWSKKINIKEKRKAIRSSLSATLNLEIIKERNEIVPKNFPFFVSSDVEDSKKTKEVLTFLNKLGFKEELERSSKKNVRAGKGKIRNRPYKKKLGPLIVVSKKCSLLKSALNLPGVDIVEIKNINSELLAPGTQPGRLTLYTENSIEILNKERLFLDKNTK